MYKKITLIDPLEELPRLALIPKTEDGYSRGMINRRKANGRTSEGTTKIAGIVADPYFVWSIVAEARILPNGTTRWLNREDLLLFEAIAQKQNDRYAVPQVTSGHLILVDEYREVPPTTIDRAARFNIVSAQRDIYGLRTGYGSFKVIISIESDYIEDVNGCNVKLKFSLEQVS